jgi:hypothetical protein
MHPLIRHSFVLVYLCLSTIDLMAGQGSAKPVHALQLRMDQIQQLDHLLSSNLLVQTTGNPVNASAETKNTTVRICSCQILDLESRNYNQQRVVLLAEKTSHGESKDYTVARNHIQKEKKHLKQLFYDKVKLVAETQGTGSCQSFYFKLKTADSRLQLYEILDADIN